MLFNSQIFVGLVGITFLLYYTPQLSKYQVQILILSSLVFYAYNQPALVLLLILLAVINILTSYSILFRESSSKKMYALLGVGLNLLLLVFFKYSPLFSISFFNTSSSLGQFLLTIPLPLGISFITFQGISLVIDTFREKDIGNKESLKSGSLYNHARRILLFISFFPKQIAGPIVKSYDFLPQIVTKKFNEIDWECCFKVLIAGYFLKMVVADNLKDFTFWISYPWYQRFATTTLLVMLYGYSCQIFADFAGYSLIAIGLAKLFGYNLQINFNFPYIATSFSEFWKRWHISLSTFLREYLYIPLGGNRKGKIRTYINLMITMFLGGLWHGTAWSYAVWGSMHGLALAVERFIVQNFSIHAKGRFMQFIKGSIVFLYVTMAWLLFKLPHFQDVIGFIKSLVGTTGRNDFQLIIFILLYSLPVIFYHIIYLLREGKHDFIYKYEYLLYGSMLFMIMVNSGSSTTFIYFQF